MKKKRATIYTSCLLAAITLAAFLILYTPEKIGGDTRYEPVLTGSMEPAIPVGGVVVIKPVNPDSIEIGDIICFRFSESTLITHRVSSITDEGFITKGDANENGDIKVVSKGNVVGKVIFTLPLIGYLGTFARTQIGLILLLFIPAITIIIYEIKNIFAEMKKIQKSILHKEENELIQKFFFRELLARINKYKI